MGFNKEFGTNENFDENSKTNIVQDAESIQQTIDYPYVKAAWDEYITLKKRDPNYDPEYITQTPAWEALSRIIDYKGKLKKFKPEEKSLLHALKNGFLLYADVLHVLIDHHDDEEAGKELLEAHPELSSVLPAAYSGEGHVIEVVIEVIKDYQWQLEHFALKHEKTLDKALNHVG